MITSKFTKAILSLLAITLYITQVAGFSEAAPGKVYKKKVTTKAPKTVDKTKTPKTVDKTKNQERVSSSSVSLANQILQTGHSYLGAPYKWGTSNGNTFDCSGLIKFIFGKYGVHLPSGSYNQVNYGVHVGRHHLKKGDLIFFRLGNQSKIGHVAVYVGDNKILHTCPKTGVKYDSLDAAWLKQGYVTARRVL